MSSSDSKCRSGGDLGPLPGSPKFQKPRENQCFYDVYKITFGRLRDALFLPRVLQMGPQVAQKELQGPKMSPFGSHVSLFFRSFSALDARWGPERCPSDLRHPKMIKNQSKIHAWTPTSSLKATRGTQKHENKLSNPNAKNCKEPIILSEEHHIF